MNKNQVEGAGKEFAAKIKQQWADLTDDEIQQAEGNIEELAGVIQRKYGETTEAVKDKLNELKASVD